MKKLVSIILVVVLLASFSGVALAGVGNNAPSGKHYNLNIIGVPKDKTADMTGNNGHRIFVKLYGKSKIMLSEAPAGEDFQVLDANGTNGSAWFQLPDPDPTNSGTSWYSVWARPVGKPGGSANMTTCATDNSTGVPVEVCSTESYLPVRETPSKGKMKFEDVSKYLLYIYVDLDGNGKTERYPIFDEALQDYFWSYNNNGLKVLQLRFYPEVPSTVPDAYE